MKDAETLYDIWESFKVFIPAKDKLEAGERLIRIADDLGFVEEDYQDLIEHDKILQTAYDRYFEDGYEDDVDEWDDYN